MKFKINKLKAVFEQLSCAIDLFFKGNSPISVHTLASASYDILRNISKSKGYAPALIDSILEYSVKDEYKKEAYIYFNKAKNFFKHADRDANDEFRLSKKPLQKTGRST